MTKLGTGMFVPLCPRGGGVELLKLELMVMVLELKPALLPAWLPG